METQAKFVLTPVAGAIAAALYPSIQAVAQDDIKDEGFLDEIIVTSTKREMNVQDIPATIQAITSETLKQMGAKNMEDYARFIPSVNVVSYANGASTIVFRGAITGSGFIAQSTSSVYLDEMSLTNTGSQPEIRTVDIQRVEALSGPQGTLYGSDAQAGTMRIVTNKPVMNEFEAIIDLELRGNSPGEESYRGSLVLNIPLVEDKLAARLVGFSDKDGGFIDNVFGHTPDAITNPAFNEMGASQYQGFGIPWQWTPADANGQCPWTTAGCAPRYTYPLEWGDFDNAGAVENDWNESEVYGGRLMLRWDISDNFSATLSTMNQITDTGAWNDYDPNVGDLQTVRFNDEWSYEEFNIHSLVLEADLGFAQLVSATGYYEREIEAFYDITVYAHYWAAKYCTDSNYTHDYTASYYGTGVYGDPVWLWYSDPHTTVYYNGIDYDVGHYWTNPATGNLSFFPRYCQGQTIDADFFSGYLSPSSQRKFTQEIRLSSEGERIDWIIGLYYEDSADHWEAPFAGATDGGRGETSLWEGSISQQYYEWYWSHYYDQLAGGTTYEDFQNPGVPTTESFPGNQMSWYSQAHTDWEQKAVFGELKWHINEEFTLTLGGRYFERENSQYYLVNHPGGRPLNPGDAPQGEPDPGDEEFRTFREANNGFPPARIGEESEFIPKVSLSWSFSDDQMVYGLFTQGKRPGGVNRSRGEPFFPTSYDPDTMDNIEFGYRSNFANGRGRLNVTAYNMEWSEYQLEITDPSGDFTCDQLGFPDEKIAGVCGQPWQQVITNAGDAHINGIMVEIDYAPTEGLVLGMNYEVMEAETDTTADLNGNGENDLLAGLRLPNVPDYKGSVWGQFNWPVDLFGAGNSAYVRTQWSFTGESFNILQDTEFANPRTLNEGYNIGDVRFGIQADSWDVSVFVNNVTDERANYTTNTGMMERSFASVQDGRSSIARIYTNRPREYGIRYSMRWGD